jgi:hypothetical protein
VELDDVRGLDIQRNKELVLKRAKQVETLVKTIMDVKSRRDESLLSTVNIFEILKEMHDSMICPEDKQIIRAKTTEIRKQLTDQDDG